jgi:hypothetical protein
MVAYTWKVDILGKCISVTFIQLPNILSEIWRLRRLLKPDYKERCSLFTPILAHPITKSMSIDTFSLNCLS